MLPYNATICWFKISKTIILLAIFTLFAACSSTAAASQAEGHLYFASMLYTGSVKEYLSDDPILVRYYLLGALGPDSEWLSSLATSPQARKFLKDTYNAELPDEISKIGGTISDVHRNKPVEISLNMLVDAKNKEESAYALGWITHFIVDSYIHDLINHYGGYSDSDYNFKDPHIMTHNSLEALESRYILTQHRQGMLLACFEEDDVKAPADLIINAFRLTYPDNPVFQPQNSRQFIKLYWQTEGFMKDSTRWFNFQATHSQQQIKIVKALIKRFQPVQGHLIDALTDLPSEETYTAELHTNPFLPDWEKAALKIKNSGDEIMPLCVLYLWTHQYSMQTGQPDEVSPIILSQIEEKLRAINPNDDLIKPRNF